MQVRQMRSESCRTSPPRRRSARSAHGLERQRPSSKTRSASAASALVGWTLAVALIVIVGLGSASALRVPCDVVLSHVNHQISVGHGHAADLSKMAKQLGTTTAWIEHCMRVYGRRPKRPEIESGEGREERLEVLEDQEPEEVAPEDIEQPAEREGEIRESNERERLHLPPTPKPDEFSK